MLYVEIIGLVQLWPWPALALVWPWVELTGSTQRALEPVALLTSPQTSLCRFTY